MTYVVCVQLRTTLLYTVIDLMISNKVIDLNILYFSYFDLNIQFNNILLFQ